MKRSSNILIVLLFFVGFCLQAQDPVKATSSKVDRFAKSLPSTKDTIPTEIGSDPKDSLSLQVDSLALQLDSLGNVIVPPSPKKNYNESPDALPDEIDYGSKGRKKIDIANKIVHLWDDAYVNYQDIQVKGEYITFDLENNIATAIATYDSSGHLLSKAVFVEGETSFQYDYLKYNFKTKKGIVKQAVTKEGELFVHGSLTKFIGAVDSTDNDFIYNKNAIVTSCNLDHPHFGIHANRLKVVPNKLAIIGPSRLEIADVPTPLWLPFGFFPIANGKSSGLILPKSYDLSPTYGFGIQNVGYYFPINDYFDLKVTGDVYLRGSWGINTQLNYKKRYNYGGDLLIARSSRNNEDLETGGYNRDIAYQFRWSHRQDAKAHPFRRFSTSINIYTSGFNRQNNTDAYSNNRDNLSSNLSYSYQFGDSPWSLSAGAKFSQSLSQNTVELTLPEMQVNMRQVFPFKIKERVGKERWFEKIGVKYNSDFKNYISATDSTFYKSEAWENARFGVQHKVTSNASFKFLKYFSFNPSINYTEIWYFKEVNQSLTNEITTDSIDFLTNSDGSITTVYDTTYGEVITDIENSFLPFRTGNASAGVATKLFWTETLQKGFLRGFRHTITPNISLNYSPDTKTPYERILDTDLRDDVYEEDIYSIIPSGVFSASQRQENFGLSFGAENIIELKYYSKKDSMDKKYKLTNFRVSTSYNFVSDSFLLTQPMLSGRSTFFQNRSSINYSLLWDPYKTESGRRIDEYVWENGFELPDLTTFSLRTTTRLGFSEIRGWITGEKKDKKTSKSKSKSTSTKVMSLGDLFDNFNFEYKLDYLYRNSGGIVTKGISSNSLNIRGNIQVTDNWRLNLGNFGYDFFKKGYTYPDLGFSRDLHCWTMAFSWQPRGGYGISSGNQSTFNFSIRVKSGSLDFLKYDYRRGNFDTRFN